MRNVTLLFFISLLSLSGLAMAQDRVRLEDDEHVNRTLLSAAVSVGVSRVCPSLEVRQLFGLFKAFELRNYARSLGYSDEEIMAYNNDPAQQARVKDWAWRYMTSQGVKEGDVESYCALGRYEIERKSLSGRLLRDTGRGAE